MQSEKSNCSLGYWTASFRLKICINIETLRNRTALARWWEVTKWTNQELIYDLSFPLSVCLQLPFFPSHRYHSGAINRHPKKTITAPYVCGKWESISTGERLFRWKSIHRQHLSCGNFAAFVCFGIRKLHSNEACIIRRRVYSCYLPLRWVRAGSSWASVWLFSYS